MIGYQSLSDMDRLRPGGLLPRPESRTGFDAPLRFEQPAQLKGLVLEALAHRASDLYIMPSMPIVAMIEGQLQALTRDAIEDPDVKTILKWVAGRDTAVTDIISGIPVNARFEVRDPVERDVRGAFLRHGFRVNASPIQYGGQPSCQIVMRPIPHSPPSITEVGLDESIAQMATPRDGIVYVAGPTGSGKTTTFSAIIRYILEGDTPIKGNIITHEEPIEYTYDGIQSQHSIVAQSQIPNHFKTFEDANREAMRRKPGLILLGELRDTSTIQAAIEASLTGHPVFGTVHANDVAAVMRRLISRYPQGERGTAIFDIVETARFIMAQRLVIGVNGKRVAAREYLQFTQDLREELSDLTDMGRVTSAVRSMVREVGHSFRAEGERLLAAGIITEKVANELASDEIKRSRAARSVRPSMLP